jgi:hypothetical protein
MPYTYVLGLVDKKKQNQVVVDLNFLAQIFWQLYVFREELLLGWIFISYVRAWRRHFYMTNLNLNFIKTNIYDDAC